MSEDEPRQVTPETLATAIELAAQSKLTPLEYQRVFITHYADMAMESARAHAVRILRWRAETPPHRITQDRLCEIAAILRRTASGTLPAPIEPSAIKAAIRDELAALSDHRVRDHIERLLVEPKPHTRAWDYGAAGERYLCWMVFEDRRGGVVFCEHGFGPRCPWGIVDIKSDSIGMDSGWFPRFLQAVVEGALDDLPIWRVYKTVGDVRWPITAQAGWEETWKQVMAIREADPGARYDCDTDALDAV